MTAPQDSEGEEGRDAVREERSRQAEKTQAVVQLAGGIAHDFNNLLMTILGNSEMLTAKLEAGTPPRFAPNRTSSSMILNSLPPDRESAYLTSIHCKIDARSHRNLRKIVTGP